MEHADMLDCYNQSVLKDIAITITTRIDHCNHYWVVEKVKYERGNDDSARGRKPDGKSEYIQSYEANSSEYTNTITSVAKDNYMREGSLLPSICEERLRTGDPQGL